jgi:hypothetical protein
MMLVVSHCFPQRVARVGSSLIRSAVGFMWSHGRQPPSVSVVLPNKVFQASEHRNLSMKETYHDKQSRRLIRDLRARHGTCEEVL